MKRLAVAAVLLLLFPFPAPPAAAAGATTVWATDRVITGAVAVEENDTLVVEAGVNISFEPAGAGSNESGPVLGVAGTLVVNGTAGRPVRFAANESLWLDGEPNCLVFFGGRPDGFSISNASFTDMVVSVFFTGGSFSDCRFDRCDLRLLSSAVTFDNCTFVYSTVGSGGMGVVRPDAPASVLRGCLFDGRDPSSHPPLPYSGGIGPAGIYWRPAIGLATPAVVEDCRFIGFEAAVVASLNRSAVHNCTVLDCAQGIVLQGISTDEEAELRGCTLLNITSFGVFALGGLRLQDSTIRDCGESGVYSYGDLLMANCTVSGCPTGVTLNAGNFPDPPDWLLAGNRIFGCAGYAIMAEGQDVDITGNRFEEGNLSNGYGRLFVSREVGLEVVDPTGHPLAGACDLAWTDARGVSGGQDWFPGDKMVLGEYLVDNAGARVELFPYTLRVRRGGVENTTTVAPGTGLVTVVLSILPDLVPYYLSTDFGDLVAGQRVHFLARVRNDGSGPALASRATFLVDGKVVDSQGVPTLLIRGRTSVYSRSWTATPGLHTLEVRLDPSGEVAEDDEANNNLTVEFSVRGSGEQGALGLSGAFPVVIVLLSVMLGVLTVVLAVKVARSHRREADGARSTAPSAGDGPARIRCPRCGTEAEVRERDRPPDPKCERCGSRLGPMK